MRVTIRTVGRSKLEQDASRETYYVMTLTDYGYAQVLTTKDYRTAQKTLILHAENEIQSTKPAGYELKKLMSSNGRILIRTVKQTEDGLMWTWKVLKNSGEPIEEFSDATVAILKFVGAEPPKVVKA